MGFADERAVNIHMMQAVIFRCLEPIILGIS